MLYAGTESTYEGILEMPDAGDYELEILAYESTNANFGHIVRPLRVID